MSLARKIINSLRTVKFFSAPSHVQDHTKTTSTGGFTGLAQIQYQDISGNWRSHSFIKPNDSSIRLRMKDVKQSYPHFKVRAVDSENKVIDITQ